jgi:hypothetical protein
MANETWTRFAKQAHVETIRRLEDVQSPDDVRQAKESIPILLM